MEWFSKQLKVVCTVQGNRVGGRQSTMDAVATKKLTENIVFLQAQKMKKFRFS